MAAQDALQFAVKQSERATPDLSQFGFAESTPATLQEPGVPSDIKGAGAQEAFRLAQQFGGTSAYLPGIPGATQTMPQNILRAGATQPTAQPTATETVQAAQQAASPAQDKVRQGIVGNLTPEQLAMVQEKMPEFLTGTPQALRDTAGLSTEERAGFGLPPEPTGEELAAQVFDDDEFQLAAERIDFNTLTGMADLEAKKAELDAEFEGDKAALGEQLARQGFSLTGFGGAKVRGMMAGLASSQLGVDREIASLLMEANFDIREEVMKTTAKMVDEAKAGRKEALDQMNKAGMALIGDQVVPTLQAQAAEQKAAQDNISNELAFARLEIAASAENRALAKFSQEHGAGKTDQYNYVRSVMEENPTASYSELFNAAKSQTSLSDKEIESIINESPLPEKWYSSLATQLVAKSWTEKGIGSGGEFKNAQKTAAQVAQTLPAFTVTDKFGNKKTITPTPEQRQDLLEEIARGVSKDQAKALSQLTSD